MLYVDPSLRQESCQQCATTQLSAVQNLVQLVYIAQKYEWLELGISGADFTKGLKLSPFIG